MLITVRNLDRYVFNQLELFFPKTKSVTNMGIFHILDDNFEKMKKSSLEGLSLVIFFQAADITLL